MRIIIKMEDGRPVLFFPDETGADRHIPCFSDVDGHCTAARAYMRSLPAPQTPADRVKAWRALQAYARHAERIEAA